MALISAAICPHPMMLIPEVAGKTGNWEPLRAACTEAVRQLNVPVWYLVGTAEPTADAPLRVVIVAGDDTTRNFDPAGADLTANCMRIWHAAIWGISRPAGLGVPWSPTLTGDEMRLNSGMRRSGVSRGGRGRRSLSVCGIGKR